MIISYHICIWSQAFKYRITLYTESATLFLIFSNLFYDWKGCYLFSPAWTKIMPGILWFFYHLFLIAYAFYSCQGQLMKPDTAITMMGLCLRLLCECNYCTYSTAIFHFEARMFSLKLNSTRTQILSTYLNSFFFCADEEPFRSVVWRIIRFLWYWMRDLDNPLLCFN